MTQRLFAAVVPPPSARAAIDAFLEPRRDHEPRWRWVDPPDVHLTTAFYGDVPDTLVDELSAALTRVAARTASFPLTLDGGGTFPDPHRAKVLWLGTTLGTEQHLSLSRRCRTAGERVGLSPARTGSVPHLTLARSRGPVSATRWIHLLDALGPVTWTVDEIRLIVSNLHSTPRFRTIGTLPLADSDPADTPMP